MRCIRLRAKGVVVLAGVAMVLGEGVCVRGLSFVAFAAGQMSSPQLADYVGLYRPDKPGADTDSVYLDGGRLWMESTALPGEELKEAAKDRFVFVGAGDPDSGKTVTFERDAQGKVTKFSVAAPNGEPHAPELRTSDSPKRLNPALRYVQSEAMIPMRDGVKLHAVIWRPEGPQTGEKLPFLMERTPYGVDDHSSYWLNFLKPELAASGYIFVYEDIRGRYKSEGQFVMNRPMVAHKSKTDVDETTDTRDTVDWLLNHVPSNNGRVGVLGVSYPGFLAMMAGIEAHPAIKAISPQAPMTDVWVGDDFFHNGAFRQTYGYDYVQALEKQKTTEMVQSKEDTYDFFLRNLNFAGAARSAGMMDLPTASLFLTEPAYTRRWQEMAVERRLTKVEVPTLEVGGYWDQEDMWGPQAEYAALAPHDTKREVFLVLGPWNHGGWGGPATKLGEIDFGEPTGAEFRTSMEAPFFEKYLKGRPGFNLENTSSFRSGVDQWERYPVWPPKAGVDEKKLYLQPEKKLSFEAPTGEYDVKAATYVADPADPVPYRHRPIQPTYGDGSKWRTWLVEDQKFVTGRKDVASFETPVLDADVTVTGDVVADLFASTTGEDGDWVAKLIDVYPEDAPAAMAGYQLMIADEILRGRYRKSFEHPEPVKPGEVNEYRWSLHGVDHTFLKGHRLMVEVQSTWFPLYDRNPQTWVPNIMTAPAASYKAETVSVYSSPKYPSHLDLPVMEGNARSQPQTATVR